MEGQPLLPFAIIFVLVFGGLGIITNGFLSILMWIFVVPFALLLISMFYMRFNSKWARVHYPLMIRYARAMGFQAGANADLPLTEKVERGLGMVILGLYPNATEAETEEVLNKIGQKHNVFTDKEMIVKAFKSKNSGKSHEEMGEFAEKIISSYKLDDESSVNGLKVSHVISELIRFKYGEQEQLNYILAVMGGRAK